MLGREATITAAVVMCDSAAVAGVHREAEQLEAVAAQIIIDPPVAVPGKEVATTIPEAAPGAAVEMTLQQQ
jgi:hypothetical protein